MTRHATALALARRLAKSLLVSGGGGASSSAPATARAAAARLTLAPLSVVGTCAPSSSSWSLVSGARALSSLASSSASSIPSLPSSSPAASRPSAASASASASALARRAFSSSSAPRAATTTTDDDDGDAPGGPGGAYDEGIIYPSARAAVGQRAPGFTAPAVVGGEVRPLSLSDYRGRYVVLLWYPKDFTYVWCVAVWGAFVCFVRHKRALQVRRKNSQPRPPP